MKLESIEDFKNYTKDGQTIYAVGTGNNARRVASEDRVCEFTVGKITRKYVELMRYNDFKDYLPRTGATADAVNSGYGGNAGYKFFTCKDEILHMDKINKFRSEICEKFRYSCKGLSDSQVERIHDIIMEEV